jgi:4-amino-4-deoxy-L-arabinose transferase-like glycosyltransferase
VTAGTTVPAAGRFWVRGLLPALGAGFLVRLWYFLDLARQPFFGFPLVDSLTYDRLATEILAGGGGAAFFRPPLYPFFLSATYLLVGHHQAAVVWVQFLLGLATVVPVFLLAERWFGRVPAAMAAWIISLYPLRIFFEGEILAVTLFSFLLAWGMWLFREAIEVDSPRLFFWAGLFFGAGVITRPNFLLVLPFLLAAGAAVQARRSSLRLVSPLSLLFGLVLVMAPVTLHNWKGEKVLIPVAGNGGINFYLGNRPGSGGETPLPPGLQWQNVVQEPLRQGVASLAGQDRYWWRLALHDVARDPAGWVGLLGRKFALFWNSYESSNNKDLPYFTAHSLPVRHYRWWFGLLVSLAAAGIVGAPSPSARILLLSLLGGYSLAVALFFVTARYRLPLVPFLALLAAAAVVEAAKALRRGERRKTVSMVLAGLLTGVVVLPPYFGTGAGRIDPDYQMGQVYLMRGEPVRAGEHLLRARERAPGDPDVANSLGAVRFGQGDWEGAAGEYRRALEGGEFAEVYFNLGVALEKMGPERRGEALESYRRSLEINPLGARAREKMSALLDEPPAR